MPGNDDLSLGRVASLCHVSRSTVYRWVVGGQLQAYHLPSGHFRVTPDDLSRFCRANGVPDPLAASAADPGAAPAAPANNDMVPSVLVVDDQPAIRLVVSRLLERLLPGVQLLEASNGVEACIRIGAVRPQLILLDIMMPGMDGFGVVQELLQQSELQDIEVVIVSAYEPFERLLQLQRKHEQVVGVHRKPIDLAQLRVLLGETRVGRALLAS